MAREAVECRRTHTGNKILSTLNNFSFACSRNSTPNRPTTQPMRFSRQQNKLFGHFTRFHTVRCRCYLGDDDIAREFHDKMHLNWLFYHFLANICSTISFFSRSPFLFSRYWLKYTALHCYYGLSSVGSVHRAKPSRATVSYKNKHKIVETPLATLHLDNDKNFSSN